jgi:poly-gamma-glutamate synthesis protein (capsule biosynthesis protein)
VYKGGAILYSLGNFLYHLEEGRPLPADSYDTGFDMFSLAMGMNAPGGSRPAGADAAWWEGAVAVATFAGGDLAALELHPVDLGVDLPSRGIPRRPALPWAVSRLETLARLSRPFGTTIRIENGVGHVRVDGPPGRSAGHPRLDVLPRSGDRQSTPATVTITGPGSNMPPSRLRFEHSYWPRR